MRDRLRNPCFLSHDFQCADALLLGDLLGTTINWAQRKGHGPNAPSKTAAVELYTEIFRAYPT